MFLMITPHFRNSCTNVMICMYVCKFMEEDMDYFTFALC
jgi:hypothetical protein